MRFALTDANGLAAGFYDDAIHHGIPGGAMPISEALWEAWIVDTQGQRWDAEQGRLVPYTPPPAPPTVPRAISRRQLLLALRAAGRITSAEALAAATTGAVPAAIDVVFDGLPEADALAARITWATMSIAEREHPLIAALITAGLATSAEVDAMFFAGAGMV